MKVLRVCPNLPAEDPAKLAAFYSEVFGFELRADMGWIAFLDAPEAQTAPLQLAREGGSGTDLPAISIEVDDLETALDRTEAAGYPAVYGPVSEPWGIRRFYFRDPAGTLVNVATHL